MWQDTSASSNSTYYDHFNFATSIVLRKVPFMLKMIEQESHHGSPEIKCDFLEEK